jgi:hypothetical protein
MVQGTARAAEPYSTRETPSRVVAVTEWGLRYLDGFVMRRYSRALAEQSIAENPRRVLMERVNGGPWREAS